LLIQEYFNSSNKAAYFRKTNGIDITGMQVFKTVLQGWFGMSKSTIPSGQK
jgi:hypothetical protein